MKKLIVCATLILSYQAEASRLGDIIDSITNSNKKAKTIKYVHRTEKKGKCEKEGKRIAQEKVIALCQEEFKKTCKKMGKPSIISPEEEVLAVPSSIEKFYRHETDDKKGCEKKALEQAKSVALLECQKNFRTNASCKVISSLITEGVRRTVHTSTFGGMFKKYKCTAKAVAQPQVNGNPVYACTVSASAKAKRGSWRDVLGDVLNR